MLSVHLLDLPLICQVNVCVQSDEEVFVSLQYLTGLEHLFGYAEHGSKYSERIFEERTRRLYSDELVQLKTKDISWKYFYIRTKFVFDMKNADVNMLTEKMIEHQPYNCLFEICLLQFLHPKKFTANKLSIANSACLYNSIDVLEYLHIIPEEHNITQAIYNDHLETVKWLHSNDYEFTISNLQYVVVNSKIYRFLVENNYTPISLDFS